MARNRILLHQPTSIHQRRQPLLAAQRSSNGGSTRFAEVAGGTTAECAAVFCCCPCAVVDLLVLAMYKVPAGLCRRALRKRRRQRLIKKGLIPISLSGRMGGACACETGGGVAHVHPMATEMLVVDMADKEELMELEKEMWDRFYSTGFWRSPSQRGT